ncbi:hypothetical protein A2U01_0102457, partial [Trifolium medium]|nr:hypothetical protein [Trifolium medium]
MWLRRLPHQQYYGRNCGCGLQFKTLMSTTTLEHVDDREIQMKLLDESKAGVKGLVDAGFS